MKWLVGSIFWFGGLLIGFSIGRTNVVKPMRGVIKITKKTGVTSYHDFNRGYDKDWQNINIYFDTDSSSQTTIVSIKGAKVEVFK